MMPTILDRILNADEQLYSFIKETMMYYSEVFRASTTHTLLCDFSHTHIACMNSNH